MNRDITVGDLQDEVLARAEGKPFVVTRTEDGVLVEPDPHHPHWREASERGQDLVTHQVRLRPDGRYSITAHDGTFAHDSAALRAGGALDRKRPWGFSYERSVSYRRVGWRFVKEEDFTYTDRDVPNLVEAAADRLGLTKTSA